MSVQCQDASKLVREDGGRGREREGRKEEGGEGKKSWKEGGRNPLNSLKRAGPLVSLPPGN